VSLASQTWWAGCGRHVTAFSGQAVPGPRYGESSWVGS